jgi:diguanylate cyclase (GGDEF)-like protein
VAGAVRLADRMRVAVKGIVVNSEKGPVSVTASFGVAELVDGDDAARLLARADACLYRAKRGGRDRVVA